MKELIKPNNIEQTYSEMEELIECGSNCRGCARDGDHCNRYCTGGANNESPIDDMDILF